MGFERKNSGARGFGVFSQYSGCNVGRFLQSVCRISVQVRTRKITKSRHTEHTSVFKRNMFYLVTYLVAIVTELSSRSVDCRLHFTVDTASMLCRSALDIYSQETLCLGEGFYLCLCHFFYWLFYFFWSGLRETVCNPRGKGWLEHWSRQDGHDGRSCQGGQRGRGGDSTVLMKWVVCVCVCVESKMVKASVLACLSNINHKD